MEELRQNYLDRLNNLHQFLYCELPLKLMNHSEDETCIDLQNRLYKLIETGYVRETEQQLQQLIEDNYKLQNKENQKSLINGLSNGEARYVKQIAELQHQKQLLDDEIENKNNTIEEIKGKMFNFEELSENIIKAEQALKLLTDENIQLSQQLEYEQEINKEQKRQIEELQQLVINQHHKDQKLPIIKKQQLLTLIDHMNSLRIDLSGLQAELKIRMQILEQFKTQLCSDLVKGFHTILSKTKQEFYAETIEQKKQHQQLNDVSQQQIIKLKKDIQFYKVLEEEYENKMKEILNQQSSYEVQIKEKDEQLIEIATKLDLIHKNIEQTEINYQQQILEVVNQKEQCKIKLNNSKNCLKQILYQLQQLQNQEQNNNQYIEERIIQLEKQLKKEHKELIDGLSDELSQSIETIKKQHNQIKQLELQCLKQTFIKAETVLGRQSEQRISDQIQDNSYIQEKSCQRTGRLDEQRRYLDELKQIHRTTKSQIRLNKKY